MGGAGLCVSEDPQKPVVSAQVRDFGPSAPTDLLKILVQNARQTLAAGGPYVGVSPTRP